MIDFQSSSISIPPISLRGTMMSSTVTVSISKIDSNICGCCSSGVASPASETMLRNSSRLMTCFFRSGFKPTKRIKNLVNTFITQTKGAKTFSNGVNRWLEVNPTFSGCIAATVFGKISEKINITNVNAPVAIATPASPYNRIPITVAIAEALIFTRLLKIRIKLSSLSGLASNISAFFAPLLPCSAKKRRRYLFKESKPVSEPEK